MISLRQVSSVTVTSPWIDYVSSGGYATANPIINPFYPIFIFNYISSTCGGHHSAGYVAGNNAGSLLNNSCPKYQMVDAFNFTIFGYQYAMGGGDIGGVSPSGCSNNIFWTFINLKTVSVNTYCSGLIPNNGVSVAIIQVLADLVQQNILILDLNNYESALIIWIIPVSEISIMLQNLPPPSMKFAYITTTSMYNTLFPPYFAIIYDGNLLVSNINTSTLQLWVAPLSQIYANAISGVPNSKTTAVAIATDYIFNQFSNSYETTLMAVAIPSGNDIIVYISFLVNTLDGTWIVVNVSPVDWSVVSSFSPNVPAGGSTACGNYAFTRWNGLFIVATFGFSPSCDQLIITVIDPKTNSYEYTYVPVPQYGITTIISTNGYIAISQQPPNNSSVTFIIYQILLDHTYVFQNVKVSILGTTIFASGILYDETENAPVANATVWLVAVRSIAGQYTSDIIPITSGTTNNNGQFSIVASLQSGYEYYGVFYA